jgi:hypothetical protein
MQALERRICNSHCGPSIAFVGPRNARGIELNASDFVMGLAIFDD